MNCVLIEDDLLQQELLLNYIGETEALNLVGCFTDVISAIKELPNLEVGIIFLDVEMPGMSGMDFLECYKLSEKTKVILTTASSRYAMEAFEKGVIDYLLKPITYPRFLKAVNRVLKLEKRTFPAKDYLFIKSGKIRVKVIFDDILWIKSASEYIVIHTLKGRYMVYSSMNAILMRLSNDFIRVHRSSIVSLSKIEKIHNNAIEINGKLIKISKSYKDDLENRIGV